MSTEIDVTATFEDKARYEELVKWVTSEFGFEKDGTWSNDDSLEVNILLRSHGDNVMMEEKSIY